MSPATTQNPIPVRDRILTIAFDLFYRQGYHATGINQIIAESGVAKASFYDHFPSKHDLLYEYVREAARRDYDDIRSEVDKASDVEERFYMPLNLLLPWFVASDYRGCPFQNVIAEAPAEDHQVRAEARRYYQRIRELLVELSADLLKQRRGKSRLDAEELADVYLTLMMGAIALAAGYRQPWPVEVAIRNLEVLLANN
jgi:AcrR family transcriptional regulator